MVMITGKYQIALARLYTLRAALKLQILGLTNRGRSASIIIKEELDLPKNKSLRETKKILDKVIEDKEKQHGIM